MSSDITLAIIKPNAVRTGKEGPILATITEAGFKISALKMVQMNISQAEEFYAVHKGKPFYQGLIEFMISGPIIVIILVHRNAVEEFRKIIGNTDPLKAEQGTIRRTYGVTVQMNAVHGSDSIENAHREANFFFPVIDRY